MHNTRYKPCCCWHYFPFCLQWFKIVFGIFTQILGYNLKDLLTMSEMVILLNFITENRLRKSTNRKFYFFFLFCSFFKRCSTLPFNFLTSFFSFTTSVIAKIPKKPKQITNRFSNSINSWFLYFPISGIRTWWK